MKLPNDTLFNIDTVHFSVRKARIQLNSVVKEQKVVEGGKVLFSSTNRIPISGKERRHNLQLRYRRDNEELHIEGSPYAFVHGQNVYTSTDLTGVCLAAMRKLKGEISLKAANKQVAEGWRAGKIELHRVDIAVNFRMRSERDVLRVLKQMARQLVNQYGSMRKVSTTVYWDPQGGKRYQFAAYAKGPQMQAKARRDHANANLTYERLIKDCAPILRIELRLMRAELKDLGLDTASAWKSETPGKVFLKYFKRLHILNAIGGALSPSDFEGVSDRMKPVLALLKLGADLGDIYSDRTCSRHRSYFRTLGIDTQTPASELKVVPLLSVLQRKKRLAAAPPWLAEAGLRLAT